MTFAILAIVAGLILLVWSADRFVEGAACVARYFGMPPLMVGMLVVGFGTSMPEMVVSVQSALEGNPGIALGNAFGSNIVNIALILGLTALIKPITVQSRVLVNELPILTGITILATYMVFDGLVSRLDAIILLIFFGLLIAWSIWQGKTKSQDVLVDEFEGEFKRHKKPFGIALMWTVIGLGLLIASSRLLVWGAVDIATKLGINDLIVGLTIVAVGTSLPELASSLIATKRGEHDIALGNVLGSNLFNTLAVTGLAGIIHPITAAPEVFSRDMMVLLALTIALFIIGYRFNQTRRHGRINRIEGALLLLTYIGYTTYLVISTII
ncbi:MAG: calcium/sodium antiporter [Eubacteriales bacterium]|nr:calcium/sodium antiporter [Eubacteriales bacterium]